MSRLQPWRTDLAAAGLLLAGLLVALSVLSAGLPDGRPNLLGPPGDWLGGGLHEALGVAVYFLLVAWFVLVVWLFVGRQWLTWFLRLAGWLILLACTAIIADQVGPQWLGGPLAGSGGTLGAWLALALQSHLHPAGAAVVIAAGVLLGLFLAADFVIVALVRLAWWKLRGRPRAIASTAPAPLAIPLEGPRSAPPPPEAVPAEPEPAREIPIRHHDEAITAIREAEQSIPEAPAKRAIPIRRTVSSEETERFADYELPPLTLLDEPEAFPYELHDQHLRQQAALLEKTFTDFGLNIDVVGINTGPVITQYEIALETGLRVHRVTSLADDLALNLKVPSVRIVAPIPGKNTVGIEVPNEHRATVRLKEVLLAAGKKAAKMKVPLYLGKDTEGKPLVYDLAEMPHLLLAGRTGTGKSVCMNAIILSILMTRRPDDVKMIMIDPKKLELSEYAKVPHLMHPIVTDMKKAEAILAWAVDKMEERYDLLSRARVRNVAGYNELSRQEIEARVKPADEEERARIPDRMPYLVLFIDEMGDLMMTMRKEVEGHIIRLAQKSRAAGIHLVVATQKPTVDVITGLIKSNLPARICFQVSSRSDSRVVLDEMGADKLLGKGDMLFLLPGTSTLMRAQGTYLSDQEVTRVTGHLECEPCFAQELVQLSTRGLEGPGGLRESLRARDELYESAIEIVVTEGRGSVSLLQRALGIGYGRAARLIDFMAEDGIVGSYNGSSAREVLFTVEQWEEMKGQQMAG